MIPAVAGPWRSLKLGTSPYCTAHWVELVTTFPSPRRVFRYRSDVAVRRGPRVRLVGDEVRTL